MKFNYDFFKTFPGAFSFLCFLLIKKPQVLINLHKSVFHDFLSLFLSAMHITRRFEYKDY